MELLHLTQNLNQRPNDQPYSPLTFCFLSTNYEARAVNMKEEEKDKEQKRQSEEEER
jgi:hypothetical protein